MRRVLRSTAAVTVVHLLCVTCSMKSCTLFQPMSLKTVPLLGCLLHHGYVFQELIINYFTNNKRGWAWTFISFSNWNEIGAAELGWIVVKTAFLTPQVMSLQFTWLSTTTAILLWDKNKQKFWYKVWRKFVDLVTDFGHMRRGEGHYDWDRDVRLWKS